MTRLSSSARSRTLAGYLTSILVVDCLQIASSVFLLPTPLTGILCTPVVLYMLFSRAGVLASLSCAAWIALVLLLPVPLSALQKKLWVRALRARDERLQLMSDLLSSVRLVKMHAWEDVHRDRVERARNAEVALMFRINLLDGLIDSLYSANSSLLMIILFGALTILDPTRSLTPGASFTCVYLLFVTDLVNVAASTFLRQRSQGSVGLSRIAKFSNEEEQDEKWMVRESYLNIGTVVLEDCSFAQCKNKDGSATTILEGVRLGVEPGSLVGVVGFVGAGKSTLLAAICGDLHCLSGVVNVRGRVALVPQLPCVHNMTVRDNILYGEQMEEDRYLCVLRACQLLDDLSSFTAGDLTEIGEKGETLSGGQMQRIALARAAYSPRDIYLLDDPLSAVDSKVADRVFHDVLGPEGLLRDKTRILVTNQGSLLRHVDTILVVHDKNVTPFYSLADLSDDARVPETIRRDLDASASPKAPSDYSATEKKEVQEEEYDRLMNQETVGFKTRSSLKLTWAVLKLSGLWVPASLLAFAGSGVAFTWQLLWMKEWRNAQSAASTVDGSRNVEWVLVLVALCLSDVVLRGVASAMMAASTRRLSLSLHSKMLNAVLLSPVSFFDTTPRGRVLNRFSLDLDDIDGRMCLSGKQCVQNTFHMIARLVVVGLQVPIVLVVGAAGALVLGVALFVAVRISHGSRFLESVRTSRMLQHLTETMDCLGTVRAFGVVDRFCAHFCRLTDWNLRAYWTFSCCYRFVRLASSAVVLVVVLVTAVFMVFFAPSDVHGDTDAGSMGLALSAVLTIPISMMALSLMLFSYLQSVVCFERTLEYTNLEPEVDVFEDANPEKPFGRTSLKGELPAVREVQWRSKGRVTFENYSASFRPGILPDVLKGITFTIEPHEKVGVVGRTGAGKSSLVLALLRVLRGSGGSIRMDGVDINRIPLRDLRRAITVIPQDPSLIRGSLRDNLDPTGSHTDDEIWEALGRVHLDHLVRGNPKGLQLDTGEAGANLSVGQRQLACLARALVRSPRLLILDEATSKMDGDTDRLIQRTLREIFGTCTILTIAHRISTLLDYDKILVLGEGRVLEFGPIAALLSRPSSHFRRMAYEAGVLPSAYHPEESYTTHL
ncbi:ATP-binding cassette sub-family C member 2 [Ixodes scapularis]|uniref:ATP-binding cassette sub-family C member 2 n=1 Tax=Ixodes scapularis TaxID=6945 RepID=UPI001A9F4ED3|nr:ATP-binding cassette sub-family C member 2 [Ixodes scapularis]